MEIDSKLSCVPFDNIIRLTGTNQGDVALTPIEPPALVDSQRIGRMW